MSHHRFWRHSNSRCSSGLGCLLRCSSVDEDACGWSCSVLLLSSSSFALDTTQSWTRRDREIGIRLCHFKAGLLWLCAGSLADLDVSSTSKSSQRCCSISHGLETTWPRMYELHWLPISERINFKLCILVHHAMQRSSTIVFDWTGNFCRRHPWSCNTRHPWSRQQLAKVDIVELQLLSANVHFSTTVSNLGVHFDNQLTMRDHVTATCRSCFFQLRQLRAIRGSLTTDAAKTLVQAFVGGRLDYCNSLLYGVSEDLLRRLQSVQNARFITGARKYDHISHVLRDLHWLPLRQRIIFKIATLMHQWLNGLAPPYLATDCISISSMPGQRQLRSATSGQLYIPGTKTMTFGPRSFKASGPTVWNDLPARLKDSSLSKNSFRKLLKTLLFDRWPLFFAHLRYSLTCAEKCP